MTTVNYMYIRFVNNTVQRGTTLKSYWYVWMCFFP